MRVERRSTVGRREEVSLRIGMLGRKKTRRDHGRRKFRKDHGPREEGKQNLVTVDEWDYLFTRQAVLVGNREAVCLHLRARQKETDETLTSQLLPDCQEKKKRNTEGHQFQNGWGENHYTALRWRRGEKGTRGASVG